MRVAQGWYQFNPQLAVRRNQGEETWQPIFAALNLPLINEFSRDDEFDIVTVRGQVEQYCAMANMPNPPVPIPAERVFAQRKAFEREHISLEIERRAALKRMHDESEADKQRNSIKGAKWGTKEAKRREIERVRGEIEAKKK